MPHQNFDAIGKLKVNGIYENPALQQLRKLIESQDFSFDFHNIEFGQEKTSFSPQVNIISPTTFYQTFQETGTEPKVPDAANENQVVSFYEEFFSKYDNTQYDKETFLYNKNFADYETEALLLSTVLQKSNDYKDFVKPYLSLEFFVNTKKNNSSKVEQRYLNKALPSELILRYLKRFVKDAPSIGSKNVGVVNKSKLIQKNLYTSFKDPLGEVETASKSVFQKGYPAGILVGVPKELQFITDPHNLDDLMGGEFCPYDIVGYVITKKRTSDQTTIKRVYILNDIRAGHAGVIKYFDSQIKENEQYSYTIEQINNIFGRTFSKNPKKNYSYPNGATPPKDSLIGAVDKEPTLEEVFSPLTIVEPNQWAEKKDDIFLPFYRNSDFKVKIPFQSKLKQMTAYPPILNQNLESPDLTLNTNLFKIPPATPDIKIFTQRGVGKKLLFIVSSLIGTQTTSTVLVEDDTSKVNVIDLGAKTKAIKFPTREFRVYRTEEKPTSYKSFPNKPRKILLPEAPHFTDDVVPNTIYYYYAEAVNVKNVKSDPTKVLKIEIVEEQGHIFPLLEVFEFGEEKEEITEKLFKKEIKVSPTFLQSAIKNMIVGGFIDKKSISGFSNVLFEETSKILEPTRNPTHKLRVTSKKTRRRFDINVIYSFKEEKNFKEIPQGAELVLERKIEKPNLEPSTDPDLEAIDDAPLNDFPPDNPNQKCPNKLNSLITKVLASGAIDKDKKYKGIDIFNLQTCEEVDEALKLFEQSSSEEDAETEISDDSKDLTRVEFEAVENNEPEGIFDNNKVARIETIDYGD